MALNTFKCNYLMGLHFKGLIAHSILLGLLQHGLHVYRPTAVT